MSEPFDIDTSDDHELRVASPCVGVCVIDESTGYCQGCRRTLSEVAAWPSYSLSQRREVMNRLPGRSLATRPRGETRA